jgi:hypothetical protein
MVDGWPVTWEAKALIASVAIMAALYVLWRFVRVA